MQIIQIKRRERVNTGQRMPVPSWVANPDAPAPCICGSPLMPGQPHVMAQGELGMKRWFHMSCWNMTMQDVDDDDDWEAEWDDEDEEDEDE